MDFEKTDPELEKIASQVVDSAFKVHKAFGPGLLESAYEACLVHELKNRNYKVERQVAVPLFYEGETVDSAFRIDLLIQDQLIVELKAIEKTLAIHEAQIMTYLKITNRRLGLLINFNVSVLKNGVRRVVLS